MKTEGRCTFCNIAIDNGTNENKSHLKPRVGNGFGLIICIKEHRDVAVINKSLIGCYGGISLKNISVASFRNFT
jgi:hypothetical protein